MAKTLADDRSIHPTIGVSIMYLFYDFENGTFLQRETADADDMLNCVEGYLDIFKFENGKFYTLTPCDIEDTNNWTEVET